jgi:CBS domain-containing protein
MKTISQVMSRDVTSVRPEDSIEQAAQKMSRLDVNLLPVCNGHKLLGVLTHRDIVRRGIASGEDSRKMLVSDIMSGNVSTCVEDQQINDVLANVDGKRIHQLPVVDHQQRLVGMVSLREMTDEHQIATPVDEAQFSSDGRRMLEPTKQNMPHGIGYNADD